VVNELVLALLLERDDDERHEDVDEEERKDDEVDDVEDGHVHAKARLRAAVLVRGVNRVLQYSVHNSRRRYRLCEGVSSSSWVHRQGPSSGYGARSLQEAANCTALMYCVRMAEGKENASARYFATGSL